MNIALPALAFFFILLPGFVARSRIKRVERQALDYSPFGQVVSEAVFWAGGLHGLWLLLTGWVTELRFRPLLVLQLLSSDAQTQRLALEPLAAQAGPVALYFGTLMVFAFLAPTAIRWFISARRLDRVHAPLSALVRFSGAPWYYLLRGADFAREDQPDLISVSAVVDVAGQPYLYTGLLDEYFTDQTGDLDRLILQQVMRRPLSADKNPAGGTDGLERFYPVDGDYFVLRYREAITLNIEYIKLQEAPAVEPASAPDPAPAGWPPP